MKIRIAKSLTQQAYELIRAQILRGELNGRQRLTEGHFAQLFGISKSPIREAVNRLEAEGLITILPRKGAFVRGFTIRDVEEIYELRTILEASVVRNIVLSAKTAAKLHSLVENAEASLRRNERERYISFDADFHRVLAQANPNSRLRKALESMHDQMLILRHKTYELSSHNTVKQHRAILDALERGDRDSAATLMVDHIAAVRDRLLEYMRSYQSQAPKESAPAKRRASAASG